MMDALTENRFIMKQQRSERAGPGCRSLAAGIEPAQYTRRALLAACRCVSGSVACYSVLLQRLGLRSFITPACDGDDAPIDPDPGSTRACGSFQSTEGFLLWHPLPPARLRRWRGSRRPGPPTFSAARLAAAAAAD